MGYFLLIGAAVLLLGSCAPAPYSPQKISCPIVSSSDWAAWINAMPGPDARPALIVTGRVTVPTGGYRFAWRDVRVMESYPVQIAVELEAVPPVGGATQAIVTHDVRGEWPMSPPVGSVAVRCGGRTLAGISPVETAH